MNKLSKTDDSHSRLIKNFVVKDVDPSVRRVFEIDFDGDLKTGVDGLN